jgi:diguanylate cyclase (GGDEF)-like protein
MLLLFVVTLLLLFSGITISTINNVHHVNQQLTAQTQHTAKTLSVSLSAALQRVDHTAIESLVDVLFLGGDFLEITLLDRFGKPLVDRHHELEVNNVPGWFIELLPVSSVAAESQVTTGQQNMGLVRLVSYPGKNYAQLWQTMLEQLFWFGLVTLMILLFGLVQLWRFSRPIKPLVSQANAITAGDFSRLETLPDVDEFRRIAVAMNHLGGKVRQMLAESEELARELHEQAHRDDVTGLSNRRHFDEVLEHRIASADLMNQGALALVQLHNFKQYNDRYGYAAGDELLRMTAAVLSDSLDAFENSHLAHLSGSSFAILIEDASSGDGERLAKEISLALTTMAGRMRLTGMDIGHVGAACFDGHQTAGELLSMADHALRVAQNDSANGWALYRNISESRETSRSASQWRQYICQALEQDRLVIHKQAVFATADNTILHEEVFVRLVDPDVDSGFVNAGSFMPMAHTLGLTAAIDRRMVEKVLVELQSESAGRLAINLSPLSLDDSAFIDWLQQTLAANREVSSRLLLEFPEYGVAKKLDKLIDLHQRLAPYGVGLTLDHFGRGFASFAYLQRLKPDYLKIDGSYLYDLQSSRGNRFFVQALTEIAHGLDIKVVAESVETDKVWHLLPTLKVDAGQGYYLAEPG